jgi:hypothetical protein
MLRIFWGENDSPCNAIKKIVFFAFIQKQSYLFLRVIGLLLVWCLGGTCEKGSVSEKVSNK